MIIEKLLIASSVAVEWILYLLIALSFISLVIAIERFIFLTRYENYSDNTFDALKEKLLAKDIKGSIQLLEEHRSIESSVALQGLKHFDKGIESIREMMSATLLTEKIAFEKGLAFIGTLGSNAPFIGLFGTVLGIINAFQDLAKNTQQGSSAVMAGISEALVATAIGLLVAIPAVALFNYFQNRIKKMITRAQAASHAVISYAEQKPSSLA